MLQRKPGSIYIDFGAWVGPTVFFASSYARMTYAMEPDPSAYAELYWNVHNNPHILERTKVSPLCISHFAGHIQMTGVLGASMSTTMRIPDRIREEDNQLKYTNFQVECTTLPNFLATEGIDVHDIALIKIDMEGSEFKLLPHLKPWINQYRPNILLSLHPFIFPPDDGVSYAAFLSVIQLYKYPVWLDGCPVVHENFNLIQDCETCEMLLTDIPLMARDSNWNEEDRNCDETHGMTGIEHRVRVRPFFYLRQHEYTLSTKMKSPPILLEMAETDETNHIQ